MTKKIRRRCRLVVVLLCMSSLFTVGRLSPAWASPTRKLIELEEGLIRFSSPGFADLNGDGQDETIIGTTSGHLAAVRYNGSQFLGTLWSVDLGASIGSSPAVGDVDGDGDLEIAIGVGYNPQSEPGAIVLIDHQGRELWRRVTEDRNGGPDGVPDGVFATPALGDVNNDGLLEIVVTGFDEELYVLDYKGDDLQNWPIHLLDNTWGSAALADLNHDGHLDIVVGAYYHGAPCPDAGCGMLHVYDHWGDSLPGWPRYLGVHLDSSPAVGDVDDDGELEIVIGTGQISDPRAYKVYAFEANGDLMPNWPQPTGGYVFSSPTLADVDGDHDLEVFVGCYDGKLYGWHHTGISLTNWPVTPINQNGQSQGIHASSPVVVDADGDEELEIFIPSGWDIVGFKIDGSSMGADYRFHSEYEIGATPAFGDPDHDGMLEVVIGNSHYSSADHGYMYLWELNEPADSSLMPWPIWRRNIQRNGRVLPSALAIEPDSLYVMHQYGGDPSEERYLRVSNAGDGTINWNVTSKPNTVSVVPSSGTVGGEGQDVQVRISVGGYGRGTYSLGDIVITGAVDGDPVSGSPSAIPVTLYVGDVYQSFLPLVSKGYH